LWATSCYMGKVKLIVADVRPGVETHFQGRQELARFEKQDSRKINIDGTTDNVDTTNRVKQNWFEGERLLKCSF
jgi:hypothetical protein